MAPKPKLLLKLVQVEWEDPYSRGGWVDVSEVDKEFLKKSNCSTVGWILKENSQRIILASSIQNSGKGEQVGELFVIPRRFIDAIIPLKAA